jgi:UTP--glucose-1-phosphate uridylyltransferase
MKKIKKAVIAVAGMGTRFYPITKTFPKEMLPIIDKPILSYIIEEAKESGIEEILLIISKEKELIKNYYEKNLKLEKFLLEKNKLEELKKIQEISKNMKISYVYQDKPLGTAYAVNLAKSFINNEPFAIMFGDDIIKSDTPLLKQMIDMYYKYDANIFAAKQVPNELVNKYGILKYKDINTKEVECIVEKPKVEESPSNYSTIGRYIVKPEVFKEIENIELTNDEYLLTDAFNLMMKYQKFYACEFIGEHYDTGSKIGYLEAIIAYSLDNPSYSEELIQFINNKI